MNRVSFTQLIKRFLALTAIALCSYQLANSLQSQSQAREAIVPVTIITEELAWGKSATSPIETHQLLAVRSDGARVARSLPSGKHNSGMEAWNIRLPEHGQYIVFVDAVKSQSTFYSEPLPASLARTVRKNRDDCHDPSQDVEALGKESTAGVEAFGYKRKESSHRGEYVLIAWKAPSLNCRTIKFERYWVEKDSLRLVFQKTALSILKGEPDPKYFKLPDGYREMTPSQANRELVAVTEGRLFNDQDDAALLPSLGRMDQQYWESQKLRPPQ
jgi:hypothetical protein